MKGLLLLLLISTIASDRVSDIVQRLRQSSKYSSKKQTLVIMCEVLLRKGYTTAFTAGVLGNIVHEGSIGKFESSNYKDESRKPQYLKYMDQLYSYRSKYSGKIVTDVSMRDLNKLMEKLRADNWKKGKFGLGCIQWTGGRTYNLVQQYNKQCNNRDKITIDEATAAEANMVISELSGPYKYVYTKWENANPNKDTISAAYSAGSILCIHYEVPANREQRAIERGNTAKDIYNILNGK